MDEARKVLSEPMETDNGHILRGQLALAESFQYIISLEYRKAEEELADLRGKLYNPGLKTELERKVDMERNTRAIQRHVDELADLAKCLKDRISLGQSFLKSMQAEIEAGLLK